MSFYDSGLPEVGLPISKGGPTDMGDTYSDVSRASRESSKYQLSGIRIQLNRENSQAFEEYRRFFKKHKPELSLKNPYIQSDTFTGAKEEAITQAWNMVSQALRDLNDSGLKYDRSKLPEFPVVREQRLAKEKAEADANTWTALQRAYENPWTSKIAEVGGALGAGLDPSVNPNILRDIAIDLMTGKLATTPLRFVLQGLGVAGLQTLADIPMRKELAGIYNEQYGYDEIVSDFLADSALSLGLPLGVNALGRIPDTALFRLAKTKFRGATDMADELYLRARQAEFGESPFNLRNDLSFPERFSRTVQGFRNVTNAFFDGKPLGSVRPSFTQSEVDEILQLDPATLSPRQRRILDDFKISNAQGSRIADEPNQQFAEVATIESISPEGVVVRTSNGDTLPLRLNEVEARSLNDSGASIGTPIRVTRAISEGVDTGQGATASIPNVSEAPGQQVAELADPNLSVKTKIEADSVGPEVESAILGRQETGSGGPVDGNEIVDSEMLGAMPEPPPLSVQNKIMDDMKSPEYLDSMVRQLDDVADDFEIVLPDDSVIDAKSMKNLIRLKDKQAEAFKICNMVDSA